MVESNGRQAAPMSDELSAMCESVAELTKLVRRIERESRDLRPRVERRSIAIMIGGELQHLLEIVQTLQRRQES